MNIIDKFISFFSPSLAISRVKQRMMLKSFDAATKSRRGTNWPSKGTAVNQLTKQSLSTLRERSRDMTRNNGYHSNAIRRIHLNVVGAGIRPNFSGTDEVSEAVKAQWDAWAGSKQCDFDGNMNFYGLQSLVMRCVAESGECLVVRRRTKNKTKIGIQLQVLEPDFIDTTKDGYINGIKYVQGVEYNAQGKKSAIWLYNEHPYDASFSSVSKRFSIDDVIHVFDVIRPGQVRGIPVGVASYLRLKDIDDYEDAQVMRQKIASAFSVFITSNSDLSDVTAEEREELERIEPALIQYLNPGEQVEMATPPGPESYNEFTTATLRSVSAGYNISYEALTNDLSNVNFSSGRMGWIEFHRLITHWQKNMMIPMLCEEVFTWMQDYMIMTMQIPEVTTCTWVPPRREMIDPVKEVKGLAEEVRNGFRSWYDAVAQLGNDPDELLAMIAKFNAKLDEMGITLDSDPRKDKEPAADVGNEEENT